MNYLAHPAAEPEAMEAIDWYGERDPALGVEFAREYNAGVARILAAPRASPEAEDAPPAWRSEMYSGLADFPTGSCTR